MFLWHVGTQCSSSLPISYLLYLARENLVESEPVTIPYIIIIIKSAKCVPDTLPYKVANFDSTNFLIKAFEPKLVDFENFKPKICQKIRHKNLEIQ